MALPPVRDPEGDNEVIFLRNRHPEDTLIWLIELGRQARERGVEQGRVEPIGKVGKGGGGQTVGCAASLPCGHMGRLRQELLLGPSQYSCGQWYCHKKRAHRNGGETLTLAL